MADKVIHSVTLRRDPDGEWDAIIDAEVAAAPPLSPEQIAALSALFDYDGGDAA